MGKLLKLLGAGLTLAGFGLAAPTTRTAPGQLRVVSCWSAARNGRCVHARIGSHADYFDPPVPVRDMKQRVVKLCRGARVRDADDMRFLVRLIGLQSSMRC